MHKTWYDFNSSKSKTIKNNKQKTRQWILFLKGAHRYPEQCAMG